MPHNKIQLLFNEAWSQNLKVDSVILYRFLCVVFCAGLAASLEQAVGADLPAVRPAETSQDANALSRKNSKFLNIAPKPDSDIARRLRQSSIGVPASEEDRKHRDELARLIEQVRSVKFKSKDQTPEPGLYVKPELGPQDNKTSSAQKTPPEPAGKPREPKTADLLPYEPVSKQTLQMLESLSQHPDRAAALREAGSGSLSVLADILFLSGQPKQAAAFYQQALDRMAPDSAASAENRAWILFQLGNCLRDTDPSAAIKTYRQLIAEYPNSLWTDLAKAREQLIDWYRNDRSLTLLE